MQGPQDPTINNRGLPTKIKDHTRPTQQVLLPTEPNHKEVDTGKVAEVVVDTKITCINQFNLLNQEMSKYLLPVLLSKMPNHKDYYKPPQLLPLHQTRDLAAIPEWELILHAEGPPPVEEHPVLHLERILILKVLMQDFPRINFWKVLR